MRNFNVNKTKMSHPTHNPKKQILVCLVNRKIFQWSLLWPAEGTEFNPGIEYKLKLFAFFVMTVFTTITSSLGLFFVITGK